ncbi:hypothetical protein fh0823_05070 [Francisella halioticida]|uniref:VirK protein n=1 Tax=Francisella halioticida TaxID=549298 RepID=A0ABM6LZN9_9GAMM|nr:VirK family protein [Francisella halioticida]ASG68070.1 hypothetical protein CDV26_06425 [Francisella halioticida]BCD90368.1 hypothetical protein fh0823_05070 [Francisella halioticida]
MKKFLLTILVLFPSFIFATTKLNSFKNIEESLDQGKKITVAINFGKCSPKINMKASFFPNTIIYKPAKNISFSDLHLTVNNPGHAGKPIYESVSYKLDAKGNLMINTKTLDANSFATIGKSFNINCQLNKGVKFYKQ